MASKEVAKGKQRRQKANKDEEKLVKPVSTSTTGVSTKSEVKMYYSGGNIAPTFSTWGHFLSPFALGYPSPGNGANNRSGGMIKNMRLRFNLRMDAVATTDLPSNFFQLRLIIFWWKQTSVTPALTSIINGTIIGAMSPFASLSRTTASDYTVVYDKLTDFKGTAYYIPTGGSQPSTPYSACTVSLDRKLLKNQRFTDSSPYTPDCQLYFLVMDNRPSNVATAYSWEYGIDYEEM